ncbi:MAG: hypothetical protein ACRDOD_13865 [Streptosporangiaceae bacterium]
MTASQGLATAFVVTASIGAILTCAWPGSSTAAVGGQAPPTRT